MSTLKIENLTVSVDGKTILNNISLTLNTGETHAIMGRNGSGKSSLSKVIIGHPDYTVESGSITWLTPQESVNVLELSVEQRSHLGLFMSFQYPVEVPGLTNQSFLKTAYNALLKSQGQKELDSYDFSKLLEQKAIELNYNKDFLTRGLNVGFSGGEKKRNEILQLALLQPQFAFLDEIDSGLDIDALNLVLKQVEKLKTPQNAFIFITHYANVISQIKPQFIHVMYQGQIILSTQDQNIAQEIEEKGFDFLIQERGSV